jgi:hypothetical protein
MKALEWAHVVAWQASRLHDAESMALASNELVRRGGTYTHNHSRPFFELRAEKHFLLIAARQLLRALKIYGDRKRVPAPRHDSQVMLDLRNALEHWDGAAPESFQSRLGTRADAHQWGRGGTLLAGVLEVDELAAWAAEVEAYLLEVSGQS